MKNLNSDYKLVKRDDRYDLYDESTGQKIASNLMQGNGLKLSTKNCEAISNGYDLDAIVNKIDTPEGYDQYQYDSGIRKGFELALEILGDKKFCEEDMISAYIEGTNDGAQFESMMDYDHSDNSEAQNFSEQAEQDFRKLLQKTEWEVEVEMEPTRSDTVFDINGNLKPTERPKLDADGCLILKRL